MIQDLQVRNGNVRLVVLNTAAMSLIEEQRGSDHGSVFTYHGHRITRMHNSAGKRGRQLVAEQYPKGFQRVGPEALRAVRFHDLKHTFGRRLRAAGAQVGARRCGGQGISLRVDSPDGEAALIFTEIARKLDTSVASSAAI